MLSYVCLSVSGSTLAGGKLCNAVSHSFAYTQSNRAQCALISDCLASDHGNGAYPIPLSDSLASDHGNGAYPTRLSDILAVELCLQVPEEPEPEATQSDEGSA